MLKKYVVTVIFLILGWLSMMGSAVAQVDACSIVGTVRDLNEALIPNAEITVRKPATNETLSTVTNSTGDYRFFPLSVGKYEVKALAPGFKTEIRREIVLEVGQTLRMDFALPIGEPSETVEVRAQAPMLTSENATMGQVIDNKKLETLPVNSRDFATLAALAPGVQAPRGTIYGNGVASGTLSGILVRGHNRGDNVYYLDGSMISEGNGATSFRPNLDGLQEFEVKTGLYGAEYGIRPGGQIIAVTKSGTNSVHGSAFWYHENDNFNARNFFEQRKAEFKRNQFGGTVGGPIYIPKIFNGKDKAWFFAAYQNEKVRRFVPLTVVVPTVAQKTGQFTTTIRDPLTGMPFPNNRIPAERINPVAQKLLKFYPDPNTAASLNFTSGQSGANSDNPQFIARIDFAFSENNKWHARFSYDDLPFLLTEAIPTFSHVRPRSTWLQEVTNTTTIAGRFVNVASVHYFLRAFNPGVSNPHVEDAAALGIPALLSDRQNPGGGLPRVNITGIVPIGDNGGPITSAVDIGNWQFKDDVSFQQGSHFIKVGAEFRNHYNFYNLGINPSFSFLARYTGNAFADFLLGLPASTQTGGEQIRGDFSQKSLYLYVQNDWKVSQKLTLNLGLRYELRFPWRDKEGFMSNFDPATATLDPPLVTETSRFVPNAPLIEWSKNGFLPRLGFAYRLRESTVIRGGYGIYSNEPDITIIQELGSNPRPNSLIQVFNANATTPTISLSNPFPTGLNVISTPRLAGVETPLKLSRNHAYGISLQQAFLRDWAVDVGYQGSHTQNLLETVSFNDARPGTGARQARRPYPQFQEIIFTMPDADGFYDSMELKVQRRAGSEGLSLLGSFTWSKGLATAANNSAILGIQRQRSINMPLSSNKSTSDTHIAKRAVLTVGYELPFGPGKSYLRHGVLGKIVGGWNVQGIGVFQDGPWISVFLPGDALDTGSALSQWPNRIADPNLEDSSRTVARWFDTAAFARPTGLVYGNAGRAPVEGPGVMNLDFSLQRDFRFTESQRLQLRFDAFNITNHPNFGLPGQNFGTASFGVIGNALDPRILQLGIKYYF